MYLRGMRSQMGVACNASRLPESEMQNSEMERD